MRAACAEVSALVRAAAEPLPPPPGAARGPSAALGQWLAGADVAADVDGVAAAALLEELGGAMQHAEGEGDEGAGGKEDGVGCGGGGDDGGMHVPMGGGGGSAPLALAMRAAVMAAALLGAERLAADSWNRRCVRVTATQRAIAGAAVRPGVLVPVHPDARARATRALASAAGATVAGSCACGHVMLIGGDVVADAAGVVHSAAAMAARARELRGVWDRIARDVAARGWRVVLVRLPARTARGARARGSATWCGVAGAGRSARRVCGRVRGRRGVRPGGRAVGGAAGDSSPLAAVHVCRVRAWCAGEGSR